MLTFSINTIDNIKKIKIERAIQRNIQYFKKINGANWEDAASKTYIHAMQNLDDKKLYDTLDPYIRALAKTINKRKLVEFPSPVTYEDGSITEAFMVLQTEFPQTTQIDFPDIKNKLTELYLLYPEDVLKLIELFREHTTLYGETTISNKHLQSSILKLKDMYGATNVITVIYNFLQSLNQSNVITSKGIKTMEMNLKEVDYKACISDIPLIKDNKGKLYGINKYDLTMEKDPDTFEWEFISSNGTNIAKIDMSNLLNYMYTQVFVSVGVDTKFIKWCNGMYKITTPAGKDYLNLDRYKFMQYVKVELLCNLIQQRIQNIIAIGEDYIYVRLARVLTFDTIRLVLHTGKNVDLPICMHDTKSR